ncbi:MAG: DNA alkylation repair protein [Patescibacteria group bacterium]
MLYVREDSAGITKNMVREVNLKEFRKDFKSKANPKTAQALQRFFKTRKGEYGYGDIFYGIKVPETRKTAKDYQNLSFSDVQQLLKSKIHEERLAVLLILIYKFEKGDIKEKQKIFNLYLKNTKYINNWDLVDLSAPRIIGKYLSDKPKSVLYKLAKSKNLWEKRIAIISTYWFIKNNQLGDTFKISAILLNDKHDLIHKAVGWMLREAGKKSIIEEEIFLKKYYKKMPRTMLRYAIEKFPEKKRRMYLFGNI